MTDDRRIERAARTWLEVGPTEAPDHTVEAALVRIRTTSQDQVWRFPWWTRSVSRATRLTAGLAAIAIVLVGGALLLRSGGATNVGGQPTPSPTAGIGTNVSVLTAGRWTFPAFPTGLTVTVGDPTWSVLFTLKRQIVLGADLPIDPTFRSDTPQNWMQFASIDTIVRQPCTKEPFTATTPVDPWSPQAGTGPEAFVSWLRASTPLTAGTATPVTVAGYNGLSLEFSAPAGSLAACGDAVKISDPGAFPNGHGYDIQATNVRLIVLDVRGRTIVIDVEDTRSAAFTALKSAADALLATAVFGP